MTGVLRFWRQGGYAQFSGILSALRDIIIIHCVQKESVELKHQLSTEDEMFRIIIPITCMLMAIF